MINPEHIVELLRAEGRTVTVHRPPTFLEDVDGNPIGLEPGETTTATLTAPVLTAHEWEATARYLLEQLDNTNKETP